LVLGIATKILVIAAGAIGLAFFIPALRGDKGPAFALAETFRSFEVGGAASERLIGGFTKPIFGGLETLLGSIQGLIGGPPSYGHQTLQMPTYNHEYISGMREGRISVVGL